MPSFRSYLVLDLYAIFKIIYLFIFGCTGSLLLCVCFLQLHQVGLLFIVMHEFHISVSSLVVECRLQGMWASVVVERGLSSFGTQAQLPHGTWNLPRQVIKPMSSALAVRFSTTVLPRSPCMQLFNEIFSNFFHGTLELTSVNITF